MMAFRRFKNAKIFVAVCFVVLFIMTYMTYTDNSKATSLYKFREQLWRFMSPRRQCGCDTCVAEPEASTWFDERFNLSVLPLLSKQNNVIPDTVYKWWLTLQGETKPKDIYEVMEELFEVIPGDLDLMDQGPYRCRTCAVVGNSGNLKSSNYGPEIDEHDFVLRMNHAPTARFEKDVGGKTTHHFVYPESVRDLQANVSMILIPFKTLDLQWLASALTHGTINRTYVQVPRKIRVSKDKVLVYSPELMKYVYDKWLLNHGRYPSTGLLAVIFALHVCDKVDLYGFGADSKGHWHHYWENNASAGAFRLTGVHDGDFEASILANLTSINKVLMFRGR
ncbi:hypothetical protein XENTR_v10017295 [Xenopus tropicalis]|uniref:CMP-N-acetylneuraminate-beta-galactosamide-alpha-2,3-sialyltransferase 1 n=2 Tax=Xenopus tropicalis TaxID=8364 RepID=F6UB93_XENTR|nr:CMP-N-acetylneuraminate-beta-galactosamide-alpha-2,3-sialyltransferase 1 isoform X1 [Xenopus tropicalis]XP_031759129.1 CMP-N-acetylneuraminate-beta-galactosamide-alpha-2,3-sialyltransferase 1 isoform X1 [Xenopus tropicalis]XP_031759130.1 CMP-N-acetylneuraminate-beta-galactosamide-alpha-2,3-sialyltransferase 1 isoform X1 [Xenopus tropicalis]KAE8599707.1 hypothetical protein XENTR_v10017295 [Xenopus tropicalis]|eukprot:XP_012819857.1 PREDICTED: CMP-N-acetylneuraminate-beta-galactosamide-alpha-2,3-sialyltransferase 1 isoform X1 [Xenopus tropicalis]